MLVKLQNTQLNTFRGEDSKAETKTVEKTPAVKEVEKDKVEITKKDEATSSLSELDKKKVVAKARKKASGWAILGGFIATSYYGLRSDKSVAKNYDLDAEKDAQTVEKIKSEQMKATLPAALANCSGFLGLGLGLLVSLGVGIGFFIHYKNQEDKLNA